MAEATNHPVNVNLWIDGDIFLYRCGFAVEKMKYLVDYMDDGVDQGYRKFDSAKEANDFAKKTQAWTVWSRREVEPVEHALEACRQSLNRVYDKFWLTGDKWQGRIFLTGKGNFRDMIGVSKGYKDNRDPTHRPKHYRALKEYLINKHAAKVVNGEEADDAIGKLAYCDAADKCVVVSNDKDLDQLAGWHYDWTKDHVYYVNEEDAIKFFYTQVLCGDATDNIGGVLSRAKAGARIAECQTPTDCAKAVREAYEKKHGDEWGERVDEIAELVWIRRSDATFPNGLHNPFWSHLHNAT